MSIILDIKGLEVNYGAVRAVKGLDLQVTEGQIGLLLGANGAGKSSTIKAILGLVKPRAGKIEFMGKEIQGLATHKVSHLGIGWVPEGRQIFSFLTVEANLLLGAFAVTEGKLVRQRMDQMMELFPVLKERREQLGGSLSGGEQQMLAIARGLMSGPKLLLMDELSLGLAPLIIQRVFELVKRIREGGVSILMSEQNARQSLKVADHVYLLEVGEVRGSGTAKEIEAREDVRRAYLGG